MSAKKLTPRAVAMIGDLERAVQLVRETTTPTPVDRAIVAVLETTAAYWRLWFPRDPTDMDRAALALARALLTETPDAAAGPLPHSTAPIKEGAPS